MKPTTPEQRLFARCVATSLVVLGVYGAFGGYLALAAFGFCGLLCQVGRKATD